MDHMPPPSNVAPAPRRCASRRAHQPGPSAARFPKNADELIKCSTGQELGPLGADDQLGVRT